ncbi:MAG: hypothetical protein ACOYKZ_06030 [Chlamydiia bacterium]
MSILPFDPSFARLHRPSSESALRVIDEEAGESSSSSGSGSPDEAWCLVNEAAVEGHHSSTSPTSELSTASSSSRSLTSLFSAVFSPIHLAKRVMNTALTRVSVEVPDLTREAMSPDYYGRKTLTTLESGKFMSGVVLDYYFSALQRSGGLPPFRYMQVPLGFDREYYLPRIDQLDPEAEDPILIPMVYEGSWIKVAHITAFVIHKGEYLDYYDSAGDAFDPGRRLKGGMITAGDVLERLKQRFSFRALVLENKRHQQDIHSCGLYVSEFFYRRLIGQSPAAVREGLAETNSQQLRQNIIDRLSPCFSEEQSALYIPRCASTTSTSSSPPSTSTNSSPSPSERAPSVDAGDDWDAAS